MWSEHLCFQTEHCPLFPEASGSNAAQHKEQGSWRSLRAITLPAEVLLGEAPNHCSPFSSQEDSSLLTGEFGLDDYGGAFML